MSEVYLDGEKVDFNGPAPASVAEVWALVDGFLSESGRLIRTMNVDGVEWTPGMDGGSDGFEVVRILAVSQLENLIESLEEFCGQRDEFLKRWKKIASRVLSVEWMSLQPEAIECIESVSPLIQSMEVLVDFGRSQNFDWVDVLANESQRLNGCVGKMIDTFEPKDSVGFSDLAAVDMTETLERICALYIKEVIPALKGVTEG